MVASEGNCFELHTESKIKIPPESGKSATFLNPERQQILLVHADNLCRKGRAGCADCFFGPDQSVADYIICKHRAVDVVVELKGTDVMRAVEQIAETIPTWRAHEKCCGKVGALIVSGKGGSHPSAIAKFQVKQDQFKKRGVTLKRTTNPCAEFEFSAFV